MKPGLYQLTQDVENKWRDRRCNPDRDWREAEVWTKGTLFRVVVFNRPESKFEQLPRLRKLHHRWSHMELVIGPQVPLKDDHAFAHKADALVKHLEPTEPATVEELLKLNDLENWAMEALQWMVSSGRLTLEQVLQAARDAERSYEEDLDGDET